MEKTIKSAIAIKADVQAKDAAKDLKMQIEKNSGCRVQGVMMAIYLI